jgi:Ca-activated chloride channel family protein
VQAEYVLDYDVISMAREHRLFLMARVKAGKQDRDAARRPLNLSVVLDRSSSMIGDKLTYVKEAAQFLVQRLASEDRISLVTYSDDVKVNLAPTPAVHKDSIRHAIQAIRAMGTTNLSGGWLQGCTLVAENEQDDAINRVLLLTDGLANRGVTDASRLAAMAAQKRTEGITTTTMGVGLNFNEDLLVQMAAAGGGAFYFIDSPEQAPHIFGEELTDLLNVVGQNLVITMTLSHDVNMVRQLNVYPATVQGHTIAFQLGDLYADETKTLVLELAIPALEALGEVQVAHLRFDYDELRDDQAIHRTVELPVMVNTVDDTQYHEGQPPNDDVIKSVLMLRAARAREQAVQFADAGNFEDASRVLSDVADAIHRTNTEDRDLQTQHDMLREEAVDMELGSQRYNSFTRKASSTKSHVADRSTRIDETIALHSRLKSSRAALERDDDPPGLLTWKREKLDLTTRDIVTIGRSPENDIVIAEEEVSNRHCRILRIDHNLYLEDLSSTNGTFANGGRVETRFRLSAGDIMTVGSWLFMFRK